MTVYVRYVDGKEYTAENWIDLVNVINNASIFGPTSPDTETYMAGVQSRIYDMSGMQINFDSPLKFFQELHRLGEITRIENY